MLRSVASFGPLGSNVIVARPCSEIGHNRRRLCDRPRIFRILLAHGSWRGVIRTAVTILMFGLEFVRLNETAILAPDPPSAKLPAPLSATQSKPLRRSAANATFLRAYSLPQPLNRLSNPGAHSNAKLLPLPHALQASAIGSLSGGSKTSVTRPGAGQQILRSVRIGTSLEDLAIS